MTGAIYFIYQIYWGGNLAQLPLLWGVSKKRTVMEKVKGCLGCNLSVLQITAGDQ